MLVKLADHRIVHVETLTLLRTNPTPSGLSCVERTPLDRLTGADALLVIDAIQGILLRQHCEMQELLNTRYALAPGTVELRDGEPVGR